MANPIEIDRRWIFLCVAVALAVTVLYRFRQPVTPSPTVEAVYDDLEALPGGSVVLIATDYDPASKAELEPMTRALLRHCFKNNLRVVGMTFWARGRDMANRIFQGVAQEYGKQSGSDYVYLGYKPGAFSQVITNMGENMTSAFPQDINNQPTANMPIFRNVRNLRDIDYMIDLAAGDSVDRWVIYGGDKYGFPMAAGCTAVVGPDLYVYTNTGQLRGLIAGLRGAADYEVLIGRHAAAMQGMPAQSTVHAIIIFFVIIGNATYFWRRRRGDGANR